MTINMCYISIYVYRYVEHKVYLYMWDIKILGKLVKSKILVRYLVEY